MVVEWEKEYQTVQIKANEGAKVSGEKVGQLNKAGPKSQNVNISFNLGKLQSNKLNNSAKKKGLEVYLDDLASLRR